MFVFLSKFLPLFIYPLGLASALLALSFFVKKESRWVRLLVGIALIILWLGSTKWVSVGLVRSLEWEYLPPADTPNAEVIVVLGGGTAPIEYPRQHIELGAAADRIFYAYWLYQEGAAPMILLSGGTIPWMVTTEDSPAENMAVILERLGVPKDVVFLETESQNTYENALFSYQILAQLEISQIILVTSAQHMPRAFAVYKKLGLDVVPAPTDYTVTKGDWSRLWEPNLATQFFNFFPSVGNLSATTNAIKEYLGIMVYKFRGWI